MDEKPTVTYACSEVAELPFCNKAGMDALAAKDATIEDLSRKLEEARGRIGELERELGRDDEDLPDVKPMSKEAYEECMRLASDYEDRRAFEVPAVAARIAELEQECDHEKKLHHQANTMRIQQMDRDSVVISSLKAALTRLKAEKEQGE